MNIREDYPINWQNVLKYHLTMSFIFLLISLPYFVMYPERILLEWSSILLMLPIVNIIFLPLSVVLALPKEHFKKVTTQSLKNRNNSQQRGDLPTYNGEGDCTEVVTSGFQSSGIDCKNPPVDTSQNLNITSNEEKCQ